MNVWCFLCVAIFFAIFGFAISKDLVNVHVAEESNLPSTLTDTSKGCLIHNSYMWLNSRRMSNGEQIPNGYALNMTAKFRPFSSFSDLSPYLAQTLADKRSSFVDTNFPGDSNIHQWAVKLIFVAIQYHQHRASISEANLRHQDTPDQNCPLKNYGLRNFDYECVGGKFIIGGLTNNGIGSNVRAAISTLILAGLVTNRTVVLIQNGQEGPKFIRKAWKLSSCSRQDYQCVFYPLTACTLTWEMVANAFVMDQAFQYYFGDGHVRNIPQSELGNRVWILQKYGVTEVPPKSAVDLLLQYIQELFTDIHLDNAQRLFFRQVLRYIADSANPRPEVNSSSFSYPAARNVINHAAEVFALRPNSQSRKMLDEIMREIIPPTNESYSSLIGLPIRASDKCHRESECLSFAGHMKAVDLAKQKLPKNNDSSGHTILFTSESVEMKDAQKAYSITSSDKFLVNFRDVTPDSGLISEALNTGNFTADESMISALSTLSFQMKAKVSVLNCCSNFHMLLKE